MDDDLTIGKIARIVERSSTSFETSDKELKRRYLLWNILAFNIVAAKVEVGVATFGTGYPFYVLDENLSGEIPVIPEQIRYNRQLVKDAVRYQKSIFECQNCLGRNYGKMKDLKTICKPCPNMPDGVKPRKLINRLPDLDMWLICEDGKLEEAKHQLKALLERNNMLPSDVDPLVSIEKVSEIAKKLKSGELPTGDMYLPIDTHIVEYSYIKDLIDGVPGEIEMAKKRRKAPYLPIHPTSLRKDWQQDDTAYNFIYDFLSAFTSFRFPEELEFKLRNVRYYLAHTYTPQELYKFLSQSATEANAVRFKTPALKKIFYKKMESWGEITKNNLLPLHNEEMSKLEDGPSTDDDL